MYSVIKDLVFQNLDIIRIRVTICSLDQNIEAMPPMPSTMHGCSLECIDWVGVTIFS